MSDKPIFWEQGLFLQPQHLQLEQRFHSSAREFLSSSVHPYLCGISRLRINEDALAGGICEVTELTLLLPGGERITFPGNASLTLRPFREAWPDPEAPLTVYVGLAPFREEGDNVCQTDEPESAPDRYRYTTPLTPDQAPDLHGKGPPADVRTLRFRLRLCLGDEMKDVWQRFLVARLVRDGERVRLDSRFIPSTTDIQAVDVLRGMLRDVRDMLLSRAKQLEEYKIVAGDAGSGETSSLYGLTLFSVLGAISRHVPELDQILHAERIHPWPVFVALCRLVGELSVFSSSLSPVGTDPQGQRVLPVYDHERLYECFSAACGIVTRLVDALVIGPDFSFVLEARGDWLGASLPPGARNSGYAYWLLLRMPASGAAARQDMAERVKSFGKLAPAGEIQDIIARAMPGVRLIYAETPPAGLPRRNDTAYLRIDQSDPLWEQVLLQGELAFFLPDPPQGFWAQLTVIRK
ncbi:MAG: type VI secretion system baseplate subunit TssK [Desulfovibrio sp.]|nr:type VI secretion system baseplate subunit TssK [Desulfovibrio sp.]